MVLGSPRAFKPSVSVVGLLIITQLYLFGGLQQPLSRVILENLRITDVAAQRVHALVA
jgi:hypothetical protein